MDRLLLPLKAQDFRPVTYGTMDAGEAGRSRKWRRRGRGGDHGTGPAFSLARSSGYQENVQAWTPNKAEVNTSWL
jgi:hypothetical protein